MALFEGGACIMAARKLLMSEQDEAALANQN